MGYCDLASAMAQLSLSDADDDDSADLALLAACDVAVSLAFEAKAGYDVRQSPIWGEGVSPAASTKNIYPQAGDRDLLFLPIPARSVSAVAVDGDIEETLLTTQWLAWHVQTDGAIHAIRRVDGGDWPYGYANAWVAVTAIWADGPASATVPDLVTQAVTFMTVEEFRLRKTSPAGEIGPEGLTVRPRNPWNFELVKQALAVYAAPSLPVF